jgi:hypothetical protein
LTRQASLDSRKKARERERERDVHIYIYIYYLDVVALLAEGFLMPA